MTTNRNHPFKTDELGGGVVHEPPTNPVDVYERLADALDALPAGFTRTPSKLEIELIKLVFTPEEASVASTLSRNLETAAEIAERVGLPEDKVTVLLESMIPRRMVKPTHLALETGVKGLGKVEAKPGRRRKRSVKKYRLFPFLVGWYESFLAGEPGRQARNLPICTSST